VKTAIEEGASNLPPGQWPGGTGGSPVPPGNGKNAGYSTKSVDILTACKPVLPPILRNFVENNRKCLSMNNLQPKSRVASQGQSNLIKVFFSVSDEPNMAEHDTISTPMGVICRPAARISKSAPPAGLTLDFYGRMAIIAGIERENEIT
jgi:hypothetical protein